MSQLSLLSGIDTLATSCESEQPKDGSPVCMCGKGTSDCSIHPHTPEKWIASMQDSLAKICLLQGKGMDYQEKPGLGYTARHYEYLGKYDPNTSSWKMSQGSFLMDSELSLETWPRWGMTLNGLAFRLPSWERPIKGIDGGALLPTPSGTSNHGKNHVSGRLDEWGGSSNRFRGTEIGKVHCAAFEEWMLGLPFMWTALTEYETPNVRSKQPSPGNSLEVNE